MHTTAQHSTQCEHTVCNGAESDGMGGVELPQRISDCAVLPPNEEVCSQAVTAPQTQS